MSDVNRKYRLKPVIVGNNAITERGPSEPSAVIQIEDTNGGFLTARMTSAQRNAIVSPAEGLMIWNTDTKQLETFSSGTNWGSVGSGGGGGAVSSVFGRIGNVVAVAGDYAGAEITVTPVGNLTSTDVQAALVELQTDIDATVSVVYATNTSPAATDATGAVGVATKAAREDHKHPAQGVSADAGNGLTIGTDGLHMFVETDEVVENAGALTGPAPAGAQWGVDTTTGQAYYVSGGNWTAMPISTVDLNMTVSSETGNNAGATPLTPPASPDTGDVHLEVYDDSLVWWSYGGATWANSASVPTNPNAATVISPPASDAIGAVGASVAFAREDHKHPAQGISGDAGNTLTVGTDGLHHSTATTDVAATNISPAATDATGAVGTATAFAREDHKHPAQGLSADAGNTLTVGSDGLHHSTATTDAASSVVSPAATDATGAVGTATAFARSDHKHPAQGLSADAGNTLTVGSDGLHHSTATTDAAATVTPSTPTNATGAVGVGTDFARSDHQHPAAGVSADSGNKLTVGSDGLHFLNNAGNPRKFADATTVAAASVASPTLTEITTFVSGAGIIDAVVYYTGTDTGTDSPTHVYSVDSAGTVTLVQEPNIADTSIYAADGNITSGQNRVVYMDSTSSLTFNNGAESIVLHGTNKEGVVKAVTFNSGLLLNTALVNTLPVPMLRAHTWILRVNNLTSGDVTVTAPTDVPVAGNRLYLQLDNADSVDRNFVMDGQYKDKNNNALGTITVAAGASRSIAFEFEPALTTWHAYMDSGAIAPDTPYAGTFNATTDWGTASGGYYLQKILATTHGITTPTVVQVYQDDGVGNFTLVTIDRLTIYSNGDVEMQIPEVPDARFAGKISIR